MKFNPDQKPKEKSPEEKIRILVDGKEETLNLSELAKNLRVNGFIRIPMDEFQKVYTESGILSHFNLERTNHKIGDRYAIVRIVKNGSSDGKEEVSPLLSLDDACVAECVGVENHISYGKLRPSHFDYSMQGVADESSLKATILKRYGSNRKDLTPDEMMKLGVGFTLLKIIRKVNEKSPKIIISEEDGFTPLHTESVSSKVFTKDGKVFKLTDRNSLERQKSDLEILKARMAGYEDHLPSSEVIECEYQGKIYTCVVQPIVKGKEIKKLQKEELESGLKTNKDFLLKLLKYFFESIESRSLYPDIVGYPKDHEYFNSINLILEEASNKLILCDVGLSPHQNSLVNQGKKFYDTENVRTYVQKMKKFQELLLAL